MDDTIAAIDDEPYENVKTSVEYYSEAISLATGNFNMMNNIALDLLEFGAYPIGLGAAESLVKIEPKIEGMEKIINF